MLLQTQQLRFAYTKRPVLDGISIHLAAGEIVVLLGPNGSGKSTLIRALLGHLPARGEITWDGRDVRHWNPRALARRVAYLAQSPVYEPDARVVDVVRLGRAPYWKIFGLETERDQEVVEETLKLLDLDDLRHVRMDELSGGQRQRAFIARSLAQEPVALLLDEPATHLDLRHHVELYRLLKKLSRERSVGVLMAGHDLNLAGQFADRIVLLSNGRVATDGPPRDVLSSTLLSQVYGLSLEWIGLSGDRAVVAPAGFTAQTS